MKAFLNLPVADLSRSRRFFKALGFHELFSDHTVACIIIREQAYAMLVTHAKFREFTPKAVCDATSTEAFISLICESRPQVEALVRKAVVAGGSAWDQPKDYGFIYRHGFQDPDGHRWELIHMEELGRLVDILTYFHSTGDLADRHADRDFIVRRIREWDADRREGRQSTRPGRQHAGTGLPEQKKNPFEKKHCPSRRPSFVVSMREPFQPQTSPSDNRNTPMNTKIFINLPVADLARSRAFFQALGFTFNEQFCDDTAACVVINEHICTMLLTHSKFSEFTPKSICDATKSAEVLICLTCENREQVDDLVHRAVASGGSTCAQPKDYGCMYLHSFQDPDGHHWELIHMETAAWHSAGR